MADKCACGSFIECYPGTCPALQPAKPVADSEVESAEDFVTELHYDCVRLGSGWMPDVEFNRNEAIRMVTERDAAIAAVAERKGYLRALDEMLTACSLVQVNDRQIVRGVASELRAKLEGKT